MRHEKVNEKRQVGQKDEGKRKEKGKCIFGITKQNERTKIQNYFKL